METVQVVNFNISNIKTTIRKVIKCGLTNNFFYNTPFCKKEATLSRENSIYLDNVILHSLYRECNVELNNDVTEPYVFFKHLGLPDKVASISAKKTVELIKHFIETVMGKVELDLKCKYWIDNFILSNDNLFITLSKEPTNVKVTEYVVLAV